ncbi:LysR family transcriptional regulator [Aestuariibius sp. 2305UL40-4]|uniref:LysR family transcriptional regulator n=1 Tax=Aestuariibius violaceus TaxID=3234132 RepID=UPI00345E559B
MLFADQISTDDLRLFFYICEEGSLTGAARRCGVSKATLSRALSRLEEAANVPLFDRLSTGLRPTQAGMGLFETARIVAQAGTDAEEIVRIANGTPRGTLRIAASALSAQQILGPVLAEMAVRYPEVRTTVETGASGPDPLAEDLDVVIRLGRPEEPYLIARRILRSPLRLYGARRLADTADLTDPAVVATLPRIVIGVPGSPEIWRLTGPGGRTIELADHEVCRVSDPGIALGILRSGAGLALLPEIFGRHGTASGDFVTVLPDYTGPEISGFASFPPRRASIPAVRVFIDLLVAHASTLTPGST